MELYSLAAYLEYKFKWVCFIVFEFNTLFHSNVCLFTVIILYELMNRLIISI